MTELPKGLLEAMIAVADAREINARSQSALCGTLGIVAIADGDMERGLRLISTSAEFASCAEVHRARAEMYRKEVAG